MFRFDAKRAFYFYPEVDVIDDKVFWLNRGSSYERNVQRRDDICLIKHGLHIPKESASYEEFVKLIKVSEDEFLDEFSDIKEVGETSEKV